MILDARIAKPTEGGASYPLRHRLYRLTFAMAWRVLASWTPPAFRAWRRALLRAFGATIAPTADIYSSARIWYPANLAMGGRSCIGPHVTVYNVSPIAIGDHAIVSQGAHLCAGTHDIEDVHFQLIGAPITIQRRAWVAAEAFVGPGVTIGEGAVLGARGCTFGNLKPWTVYGGNPARVLKLRAVRFSVDQADDPG